MSVASRTPAERDTRKMVMEIPTAAPALRPAMADCGSGSHPGSIGKNAIITYTCGISTNCLYNGKEGVIHTAVSTSLN